MLVGMVIVYLVNAQLASGGNEAWRTSTACRWMFASEAIPALLFFALAFTVPESPRWLALKGRKKEASKILYRIGGEKSTETLLEEISASEQAESLSRSALFRPPFRAVLLLGLGLAFLQQATGINIVMYYAPTIFVSAGLDTASAAGHSILIGLVMLGFTLIAMALADKLGRRPLLLLSSTGMAISLIALGFVFTEGESVNSLLLLMLILLYVASFSIATGPLVWTVIAEIFPNKMRGRAVGLCVFVLWLANFTVSQFFPYLLSTFEAKTFWIYGAFSVFAVYFIATKLHETKGMTLEATTQSERY